MNTINYFKGCITPEQIKETYRELAFTFHPDKGGDLEIMKMINAQYHDLLKGRNGLKSFTTDNQEYTYKYDESIEQAVIDKINEFISRALPNIDLLLIGNWLWITGSTKEVKDHLKAMGFKWHRDKACWFWHAGKWYGKGSKKSLADIADTYGYKKYSSNLRSTIGD